MDYSVYPEVKTQPWLKDAVPGWTPLKCLPGIHYSVDLPLSEYHIRMA